MSWVQKCIVCTKPLDEVYVHKYQEATYNVQGTQYKIMTPRVSTKCSNCNKIITFSSANFYTLYYIDAIKTLLGKIHAAKKEV